MNQTYQQAKKIVCQLQNEGFEAYFVGGCVRDMLMGREPLDYDIATSASVAVIRKMFRRTVPVGAAFGVVMVLLGDHQYQISTFRGHRCTAQDDAMLRDFTINGIFFDPVTEKIFDWVNGQNDIADKIIRAIGCPHARFEDDHLRMLRAVRFSATLGFSIDDQTDTAICSCADKLASVSNERIRDELVKITEHPDASNAIDKLRATGLFQVIFPDLDNLYAQRIPDLKATPFELIATIFDNLELNHYYTGMAALLSLPSFLRYPQTPEQPVNAGDSALVAALLRSYMFSNTDRRTICSILHGHRFFIFAQQLPIGTIKRYMRNDWFTHALAFHKAHLRTLNCPLTSWEYFCSLHESFSHSDLFPTPLLTGNDLHSIGLHPGPQWGELLDTVEFLQLDGQLRTRDDALRWLDEHQAEYDRR